MNLKVFVALIILLIVFSTCSKDSFIPVKVTYLVKIADSSTVNISYNSDYYYDSGTRKPVNYLNTGGIWSASHIAYEEEEYYIKVDYLSSINPETDFQVKVIFNDTSTVDSVKYDSIVSVVELQGTVNN
ncbi:MAG: hypothetical protein ACHQNT_07790 [Bacteroidia bacterium]